MLRPSAECQVFTSLLPKPVSCLINWILEEENIKQGLHQVFIRFYFLSSSCRNCVTRSSSRARSRWAGSWLRQKTSCRAATKSWGTAPTPSWRSCRAGGRSSAPTSSTATGEPRRPSSHSEALMFRLCGCVEQIRTREVNKCHVVSMWLALNVSSHTFYFRCSSVKRWNRDTRVLWNNLQSERSSEQKITSDLLRAETRREAEACCLNKKLNV